MIAPPRSKPLRTPSAPPAAPDLVSAGPPIPPIERIRLFSSQQWEELVLEWVDSLRETYASVERWGGPGDHGCDIIAVSADDPLTWDNYQCKHYKDPLQPGDVWVELGKLVHYTMVGEYSYPRNYFFVAPHGVGTKLSNLLRRPEKLRAGLVEQWQGRCERQIGATPVFLNASLRAYLDQLDFSIFRAVQPHRLLEEHAKTQWHLVRFGGGLPARPPVEKPPAEPTETEANYVRALLAAYAEHLMHPVPLPADLVVEPALREHFDDSRIEFYSAESLRVFSRDTLPPGTFGKLQDEIHFGIRDELRADHADGYQRVRAVVKTARTLQLLGHALHQRLSVRDYGGVCHQLANDLRVRWVK